MLVSVIICVIGGAVAGTVHFIMAQVETLKNDAARYWESSLPGRIWTKLSLLRHPEKEEEVVAKRLKRAADNYKKAWAEMEAANKAHVKFHTKEKKKAAAAGAKEKVTIAAYANAAMKRMKEVAAATHEAAKQREEAAAAAAKEMEEVAAAAAAAKMREEEAAAAKMREEPAAAAASNGAENNGNL